MKKSFLFLMMLFPLLSWSFNPEKEEVLFGTAKVNITPETPLIMSGYGKRKALSTGIHDDLFASALCFSKGDLKVLLITCDLIGFSHSVADETILLISKNTGIDVESIFLTAVHTHGAPVVKTYDNDVPNETDEYVKTVQKKLVQISVRASSDLQQVRIGYGKGNCTMNINRRAIFPNDIVRLGSNPDGPCDHEVSIIKIEDVNGGLKALFVNWPCHGTAGGQDNYKITGDWPGMTALMLTSNKSKI